MKEKETFQKFKKKFRENQSENWKKTKKINFSKI